MTHIISPQNHRLKSLRRLQRRSERERTGRFLAEGEDLIAAAERAGRPALEGYRIAGSGLGGAEFHDVEPAALATVSTLASGTRVIGVYEQRWSAPAGPLCLYLHGVGDPGNVGTVLRGAQAFGAASVALGPGCADPHSPKAIRASMGAIFDVALARVSDLGALVGERIALLAGAQEPLRGPARTLGPAAPVTLLIGAEREGLPTGVLEACDRRARIPIASDSLNAAMAATVAMYEMTRQAADAPASSRVRTS
ncbi:MAG: RNA methyltransferase [Solirubrobacteraceae bacterium]|jgi:TrmH family RNA methyltransferase